MQFKTGSKKAKNLELLASSNEALHKLNCEMAEKVEQNKLDGTGAIKEAFFHSILGELIRDSIEIDKTEIRKGRSRENINFLALTIRDLSRVNKEGMHTEGDQVLSMVVENIEQLLLELNIEDNAIYHMGGADFILIFHGGTSKLINLVKAINSLLIPYKHATAPAHVSVFSYTLNQLVTDTNNVLHQGTEKNQIKDIHRYIATVLMQAINFGLEYQKLRDTLADLHSRPKGQKSFFGMYVKYMFTTSITLKELATMSNAELDRLCLQTAYEKTTGAEKRYSGLLSHQLKNFSHAGSNVIFEAFTTERNTTKNFLQKGTYFSYFVQEKTFRTKESEWFEKVQQLLTQKSPKENESRDSALQGWRTCKQLVREFMAEPKLIAGYETLLKTHLKLVNKLVKDNQAYIFQRDLLLQTVEIGYRYALIAYDELTGLKNREQSKKDVNRFYDDYTNFSLINIDLAFLKYFNARGGRKTIGNLAIRKAAYILDIVKKKFSREHYNIEVYRSGGDEFAVIINAPSEIAVEVAKEIERESMHKGPIPTGPHSKVTYFPERIRFDAGIVDIRETERLLKEIVTNNPRFFNAVEGAALNAAEPTCEQRTIKKSLLLDAIFKIADIMQESTKGVDRFAFLLKRYNELALAKSKPDDQFTREKFETLLSFSGKALGGYTVEDFAQITKYALSNNWDVEKLTRPQLHKLMKKFFKKQHIHTLTANPKGALHLSTRLKK